jgi:beta-phosphoglucomutase-like phosphatase (HAD superfamily)
MSKNETKRAFIFDLDGVIIETEPLWKIKKQEILHELFGKDILHTIGHTKGVSLDGIYDLGKIAGADVDYDQFVDFFHAAAEEVYSHSPINKDIDDLVMYLHKNNYLVGLVSASPMSWVSVVLERLNIAKPFECIIGLHGHDSIRQKPWPDGYQEAMKRLDVTPKNTVILEDSLTGIQSAMASGAYTIGLLDSEASNKDAVKMADSTAKNMNEVIIILRKLDHRNS